MENKLARCLDHQAGLMNPSTPANSTGTFVFRSGWVAAKRLAIATLALGLGVASAQASDISVKMTFSGTSETSPTNLAQPDTGNDGDNFSGNGTLGAFTVRNLRAISNSPSSSPTCAGATQLFLPELSGAGVFHFQDGSLLEVNLTQGGDCIDLVTGLAHCILSFQITGGTGRFLHASGDLTMTETVSSVLNDALGNPVFFAATGKFIGTVSGVAADESHGAD